jgi:hypothetical protein
MDEQEKRERSPLTVWLIAGAVLSPVAYVLSTGPAVWLHNHSYLSKGWFVALYRPLAFAASQSRLVNDFFKWYLDFWQ